MLDHTTNIYLSQKWFRFGDSMVNLSCVVRIFRKDKTVTLEFPKGDWASYDYETDQQALDILDQLFEFLS